MPIEKSTDETPYLHKLLRVVVWIVTLIVGVVFLLYLMGTLSRSEATRLGIYPCMVLLGMDVVVAIKTKEIWMQSLRFRLKDNPRLFVLRLCASIAFLTLLFAVSAGVLR